MSKKSSAVYRLGLLLGVTGPPDALTKFIRNIEMRVLADMQSAPLQELNKDYGLLEEGRPDM